MKGLSKIKSYVGFAIKAKKTVFGVDNILKVKRGICLIIYDDDLGAPGKRKIKNFADKDDIICCQMNMKDIISKENCKAIGLKEKNLANAIIQVIKESKTV
ncbi:MAG: hypothetical protein ACOCWI_05045 [Bacillota bacterium]